MKQYTTETQKPTTDKKDTRHDNTMLVLLQPQVIYLIFDENVKVSLLLYCNRYIIYDNKKSNVT